MKNWIISIIINPPQNFNDILFSLKHSWMGIYTGVTGQGQGMFQCADIFTFLQLKFWKTSLYFNYRLQDISVFNQVLTDPEYKKNPLGVLSEHLRNKLQQEDEMDT